MIQIIDPRPLEPNWVFDDSCNDPGELRWTSRHVRWSPYLRSTVTVSNSGSKLTELFQELETLIRSEQEAEVFIDASSLEELEQVPSLADWVSLQCKIPSGLHLFYEITINHEEAKDCADGDDTLGIIEKAIYDRQVVELNIRKK